MQIVQTSDRASCKPPTTCIIIVIQRQSVSVHSKIMVGPGSLLVPSPSGATATPTPAAAAAATTSSSTPSVSVGGGNLTLYDEREVMEEFISCYRHFTALWDSTSVDYLSKFKKEPGYQELLKILRRLNGDSSVQDVKRKINSLRCCYRREIKKVQSSQNGYKPRLWWYHLMDFLKPVLHIQSPVRVKSESLDDSLDETSINDDDLFQDSFPIEEDALGMEGGVSEVDHDPDHEVDPEPDPDPESESGPGKMDNYPNTSSVNIKSSPYSSHHRRIADKSVRIAPRIRRHSSNDSDYGENDAKRGRSEDIPTERERERARERVRDRERDRERERERECENECDLIGKRMAAHFRNMRPDQRLYAERIISEVLVYGRMNRLTMDARFHPGK
ncbi:uncharacterized protein Dana_GF21386, isoform C [Drosophila ananassae]|uniref:Uncharacterized protein, isoform C n=2 Tax=Drosophila ananassae TaxID=7217 RepID=A0A0P8Y0A8_DROAN|nr:uncharacterized protein Dana_GF21386, isoform C [Drosophila ananassae]